MPRESYKEPNRRFRSRRGRRRPRPDGGQSPHERISKYLGPEKTPAPKASPEDTYLVNSSPELSIEYLPALFAHRPELIEKLAWVSLRGCNEPAVPQRLLRSRHLFGNNYVFMKRELLDFHILPENKARKLEFILGDALRRRKKRVATYGYVGSAHCLASVKAAHELNMKSEVVLMRAPLTAEGLQMTAAMKALGAKVSLCGSLKWFRFRIWLKKVFAKILGTEIIPSGGATMTGVFGYINAMFELKHDIEEGRLPEPDMLFVATGTGTTLVGMELGRRLAGLTRMKIVGIEASQDHILPGQDLAVLGNEASTLMNKFLGKPLHETLTEKDFHVLRDYTFGGYGQVSNELERWMSRFLELESVELDPIYTGKALYGMSEYLQKQSWTGKTVLFWNTGSPFRTGDLPKNFSYSRLSRRLKKWVREEQALGRLMELGRI